MSSMRGSAAEFKSRQRGVAVLLVACLVAVSAWFLLGCGEDAEESPSGDSTAPVRGGVLRIASQETVSLDPATNLNSGDYLLNKAVYDYLVDIDEKAQLHPSLAESWESADAKTWTFKLREGVVFHDGSAFTSADVVYTIGRIMDPDVGAASYEYFKDVEKLEAVDDYTVQFVLKDVNPEFPLTLAEVHQAILPEELTNPRDEAIGTGPFVLESFSAGNRAVLVANKDYWRQDDQGQPLPYLDGLEVIFSPDVGGQVEALRAGDVDWVGGLSAEHVQTLAGDPGFKVLSGVTNTHYTIFLRSDRGPTKDPRVRKAFELGTDQVTMSEVVRPGFSEPGNGTMVGPLFAAYYLDQDPPYDPEEAKRLLAEAGYPEGLSITLFVQTYTDCPAIATVWKEQMAKIGVDVEINLIPPDVWYGDGEESWLKVDFGIIDWATRIPPLASFNLAYRSTGPWNAAHWSSAEFDAVCDQIAVELDDERRAELYREAQNILLEENPYIVTYMELPACASAAYVHGITLDPEWSCTVFTPGYIAE